MAESSKKTFIDKNGYQRFNDKNKRLFHRWMAEKEIYNKNRKKYPLEFEEYQVHHIDGVKLNNRPENLKILTRAEHEKEHGMERYEWNLIRVLVALLIYSSVMPSWIRFMKGIGADSITISLSLLAFLVMTLFIAELYVRFKTRKVRTIF